MYIYLILSKTELSSVPFSQRQSLISRFHLPFENRFHAPAQDTGLREVPTATQINEGPTIDLSPPQKAIRRVWTQNKARAPSHIHSEKSRSSGPLQRFAQIKHAYSKDTAEGGYIVTILNNATHFIMAFSISDIPPSGLLPLPIRLIYICISYFKPATPFMIFFGSFFNGSFLLVV